MSLATSRSTFDAAAETHENSGEAGDGSSPVEADDETLRPSQKTRLAKPRPTRHVSLAALVCAALMLLCNAGLAQQPQDDAQARGAARDLARQGDELMAKGNCVGALDRFGRAYALVAAPTISILEARCLTRLGRLVEAADKYDQTRRTKLNAASPKPFWIAVGDAARELQQLRARIPRLRITVRGVAPDAAGLKIELDGAVVPTSLIGVDQPVNPGEHVVSASLDGAERRSTVSLAAGESRVVDLAFEPAREAQPAAPPPAPVTPAPAQAQFDSTDTSQRTWGWVVLGVGAAGLVAGGVTGAIALDKKSTLDDVCAPKCPTGFEDDIDTFRTMRTLSWVGFGIGIAGVGVGLGLLATSSDEQPALDAWVGPGMAGVRGAF